MNETERCLQAAIDAAPLDTLPRLVLCDWLDEQGDELAAGYRVLATFDRWPFAQLAGEVHSPYQWWSHTINFTNSRPVLRETNHGVDRSELPHLWLIGLEDGYPTRRESMDAAALAWSRLTPEQQAEAVALLGQGALR